ncbi:hypothetical protein PILCRDRAFT_92998 [Piloderma croceum F 1598]|uniref:Uncharacterized protein n=1 Tax=Piloderma croceum (strain F 1598) TaxID=765440 RepID=A0A0C3AIB6_PILCF|nr:hypothetical protein PILCRDRAFT_92998 [Piloderma croceum F 1598]
MTMDDGEGMMKVIFALKEMRCASNRARKRVNGTKILPIPAGTGLRNCFTQGRSIVRIEVGLILLWGWRMTISLMAFPKGICAFAALVESKSPPNAALLCWAMNCVVVQNSGISGNVVDHLFRKYPHSMTTIAIAAVRDLWTYRKVRRDEIPKPAGDQMNIDKWNNLMWRPYVTLVGAI